MKVIDIWGIKLIKNLSIVYFLFIFLISCNKPLGTQRKISPLGLNELQCINGRVKIDPILIKIQQLFEKSEALIISSTFTQNVENDFKDLLVFNKTPLRPQTLSIKKFKKLYQYIKDELHNELEPEDAVNVYAFLFGKRTTIETSFNDPRKVSRFLYALSKLNQVAERFKSKSCNLLQLKSQKSNDVRDYFIVKDIWESSEQEIVKRKKIRPRLEKLCQTIGKKCDFNSDIKEILNDYKRAKVGLLYEVKKWGFKNIGCSEIREREYQLKIPTQKKHLEEFKKIAHFWENKRLKLSFYPHPRGLRIVNQPYGPSFVKHSDFSTINLDKRLDPLGRQKVLAHELGHVFGFEDCYVEFYNDDKEIIYYEIDESNLMCSVDYGSRVKESYIKNLITKYCLP